MITNRKLDGITPTHEISDEISYFISGGTQALDAIASWNKLSQKEFADLLKKETNKFPLILDPERQAEQKHLGVFVHGFNNSWQDAAKRYRQIADTVYGDLGQCVLFTWPSDGIPLGYVPDRIDARRSADSVAKIFMMLYDWMVQKQEDAIRNPTRGCRAKVSVIGHSMGGFILQKGLKSAWNQKNQPLLAALINQLMLVAADVDNTLFASGETVDGSDGDAMANLCYRITALYTGRDNTLGLSAGFKHFGQRRLGRSGLSRDGTPPYPSNVWDVDCTDLIDPDITNVHSAYFDEARTVKLMREILVGTDRSLIMSKIKTGQI